jgi:micrococcal nuclease
MPMVSNNQKECSSFPPLLLYCLFVPLLFVLSARELQAIDFSGLVVSGLDGDTIEVLHNTHPERIRLNDIDCPEKGQVYSKRAKQAASELVFGKEVTLQTFGKDKYGRTIADVFLPAGIHVNHTLVKDGWCWWYRKYAPEDTVLEGLETEAREVRITGVLRKARVPTR